MALAMSLAGGSPAGLGVDGGLAAQASATSANNNGLAGLLTGKQRRADAPPAYLNYLFFDGEMNYRYGGYTQMSEAAYEDGSNRPHERLYSEVVAEEPGYFYIYPPEADRLCPTMGRKAARRSLPAGRQV